MGDGFCRAVPSEDDRDVSERAEDGVPVLGSLLRDFREAFELLGDGVDELPLDHARHDCFVEQPVGDDLRIVSRGFPPAARSEEVPGEATYSHVFVDAVAGFHGMVFEFGVLSEQVA